MSKTVAALALLLILAPLAHAQNKPAPSNKPPAPAGGAPVTLTFENKMVNGKKTWLPAESHVPEGAVVNLKLVNTLPEPHGFEAVGFTDKLVIKANETKTIDHAFVAKGKGKHEVRCQLHPAHVGATIIVD